MNKKKIIAVLMLLLTSLIWGVGFSVQSIGSNSLGTYTLTFFKCSGSLILLPIIFISKRKFTKKTVFGGIIVGLIFFFACTLQQKGIELSSVGKSSFLTALYIVFTPMMSILLKKKPNIYQYLGVIIAVVGMYFLCIDGDFEIEKGDLYLIVCAVFMALQIIAIDIFASDVDPMALACVQGLTMTFISGIVAFISEPIVIEDIKVALPQILYLAILSFALAEFLQVKYQVVLGPTLASLIMSFESVFGALGGVVIMHQLLSTREIVGCVLIFVAVLIAQIEKKNKLDKS